MPKKNELANSIDIAHLRETFHLPIDIAAKNLGVCATVLKRVCRGKGIKRWPYRKLKSLNKMITAIESYTPNREATRITTHLSKLRGIREAILNGPYTSAANLSEETIEVCSEFYEFGVRTSSHSSNGHTCHCRRSSCDLGSPSDSPRQTSPCHSPYSSSSSGPSSPSFSPSSSSSSSSSGGMFLSPFLGSSSSSSSSLSNDPGNSPLVHPGFFSPKKDGKSEHGSPSKMHPLELPSPHRFSPFSTGYTRPLQLNFGEEQFPPMSTSSLLLSLSQSPRQNSPSSSPSASPSMSSRPGRSDSPPSPYTSSSSASPKEEFALPRPAYFSATGQDYQGADQESPSRSQSHRRLSFSAARSPSPPTASSASEPTSSIYMLSCLASTASSILEPQVATVEVASSAEESRSHERRRSSFDSARGLSVECDSLPSIHHMFPGECRLTARSYV